MVVTGASVTGAASFFDFLTVFFGEAGTAEALTLGDFAFAVVVAVLTVLASVDDLVVSLTALIDFTALASAVFVFDTFLGSSVAFLLPGP